MPFSFNKLWSLLAAEDMTKEELRNKIGASQTTIVNLGKNKNVSLDVVDRICETLQCVPDDIMEYIPTSTPIIKQQIHLVKGDIYYANFQMEVGEGIKPRPVLIYQSNLLLKMADPIMVIPFSSSYSKAKLDHISIVEVPPLNNIIQKVSVLELNKLTSIRRVSLMDKIGSIPDDILKKVDYRFMQIVGVMDR